MKRNFNKKNFILCFFLTGMLCGSLAMGAALPLMPDGLRKGVPEVRAADMDEGSDPGTDDTGSDESEAGGNGEEAAGENGAEEEPAEEDGQSASTETETPSLNEDPSFVLEQDDEEDEDDDFDDEVEEEEFFLDDDDAEEEEDLDDMGSVVQTSRMVSLASLSRNLLGANSAEDAESEPVFVITFPKKLSLAQNGDGAVEEVTQVPYDIQMNTDDCKVTVEIANADSEGKIRLFTPGSSNDIAVKIGAETFWRPDESSADENSFPLQSKGNFTGICKLTAPETGIHAGHWRVVINFKVSFERTLDPTEVTPESVGSLSATRNIEQSALAASSSADMEESLSEFVEDDFDEEPEAEQKEEVSQEKIGVFDDIVLDEDWEE